MANIYNFLDLTCGRSLRVLLRRHCKLHTEVDVLIMVLNIRLEKQIADIVPDFYRIAKSIGFHFQHRFPLIVLVSYRPELVVDCFDQLIVTLIFAKEQL